MSIYSMFETDPNLEADGIALEYGDATFIVARAGRENKKFQHAVETRLRPYRNQMRLGTLDDEVGLKLVAEAYAESVILAWDGVTDRDGEPLEFNRANVVKVLLDLPVLFKDIQEQSQHFANFLAEARVEDAKS